MLKSLGVVALAFGLLVSSPCLARSVTGKLQAVFVNPSTGIAFATFDRDLAGTAPSCVGSGYLQSLAFDAKTDGGKALLSLLLAGLLAGKSIQAGGTDSCSAATDIENFLHAWIQQ